MCSWSEAYLCQVSSKTPCAESDWPKLCVREKGEKQMIKGMLKTLHPQKPLEDMLFTMEVTIVYPTVLKYLGWDPEPGSSSIQ